jgi:hypothetical protein
VRCPRLTERRLGIWYFRCYVRDLWGKPVQVRRGGFTSDAAARAARAQASSESREQFAGRTWTVARWLRYWLTTRRSSRAGLLQALLAQVADDHGGQERDNLGSLFRSEGRGLRLRQRELG